MLYCYEVPTAVLELLREEVQDTTSVERQANDRDFQPSPRYNISNTVNIPAGSEEIAVGAILSKCAACGM